MAAAAAGAPTANGPYGPWLIAAVVGAGTFMEVLDITIAAVALPEIAGGLSATIEEATWVLTGYLVATAIVLPMSGWLATAIGRKRFYMWCIAGFTVCSLGCGVAPNLEMLILFRVLQGVAGAGMVPMSQAILADSFPPEKRSKAFGAFALVAVLGPALGPTLGGWITDHWSWHWVFLINVPVGVVLLALTGLMLKDPPWVEQERQRWLAGGLHIDYLGFVLIAMGLGSLVLFLEEGQDADWFASGFITLTAVLAAVSLAALAFWEWRHPNPVLDVRLFTERGFAAANGLVLLFGAIAISSVQIVPQFAQQLLGWTATDAGLAMTFGALTMLILMPAVGNLGSKVQPKYLVAFGLLIEFWAYLYLYAGMNTNIGFWGVTWARLVQILGFPFIMIPTFTAAYQRLPPQKNNQAAALLNMNRAVGGGIGVALVQIGLLQRSQFHQAHLVAGLSEFWAPFREAVDQVSAAWAQLGAPPELADLRAYGVIYKMVQAQARMLAYIDIFTLTAFAALAALPLAFLLPRIHTGKGASG